MGIVTLDLWSVCMERALPSWKPRDALPGDEQQPESKELQSLLRDGVANSPSLIEHGLMGHLGLHFSNPMGYETFYRAFVDKVSHTWPDLDPSTMPYVFPPWNEALSEATTSVGRSS